MSEYSSSHIFKITRLAAIFCFMLLTLLAGCSSGNKELIYKTGADLTASQQYCEAYEYYKNIMALPDHASDKTVRYNLEISREECVKQIIKKSRKLISSGKYEQAVTELKKAVEIQPANTKVVRLLANAKANLEEFQFDIASHEAAAKEHIARKEWLKAQKELKKGLSKSPQHKSMQKMLFSVESELQRAGNIAETAREQMKNREWRKAQESYLNLLKIQKGNKEGEKAVKIIKSKIKESENDSISALNLLTEEKYSKAEKLFKAVIEKDPESQKAIDGLAQLYNKMSLLLENGGYPGVAAYFKKLASDLNPTLYADKDKQDKMDQAVFDRIASNIAILPFKEYSKDSEFSDSLSAEFVKNLQSVEYGSIVFVVKKMFEKAFNESGLSIDKISEAKNLDGLKQLKEISAVISGKVNYFKISAAKYRKQLTKRYQTGTVRNRNPEYDQALEEVRSAELRADTMREAAKQAGGGWAGLLANAVSGVTGGADVGSARAKLAQTPEYLESPLYGNWKYTITKHKKSAEASIIVRVISSSEAKVISEETIEVTASKEFDSIDNPKPDIGIEEKNIPDNIEEELKKDILNQLAEKYKSIFPSVVNVFAKRFIINAQDLDKRKMKRNAAEEYVNFLYAVKNSSEFKSERKAAIEYISGVIEDK